MLYNCLDHLELAGGRRGTLGGLTEAFGNIHLNLRDDTGASEKRYHGTSFFLENLFFSWKKESATPLYRYPGYVPFLLGIIPVLITGYRY
jgi:hypothetical protein